MASVNQTLNALWQDVEQQTLNVSQLVNASLTVVVPTQTAVFLGCALTAQRSSCRAKGPARLNTASRSRATTSCRLLMGLTIKVPPGTY